MPNLNTSLSIVEGMPSPTSNDQQTAVEAEESGNTESGNTKIKADKESEGQEGLPGNKIRSGIELAPMDNIVSMVNDNLRNCVECKTSCLQLKVDLRVGFASNWKLSCTSCDKIDQSHYNNLSHLKRNLQSCTDITQTRIEKKKIRRKKQTMNTRKK